MTEPDVYLLGRAEADYFSHICDPPLPAWTHLIDAFTAYTVSQGIDVFVGRRIHRLFREAGVSDIRARAVKHVYPPGHDRGPILRDFIATVRASLIGGGFITEADLERHLADPDVMVTSHMFFRLIGRVPG